MKPRRAITILLVALLIAACGNHNNVQIGSHDPGATANSSNAEPNNNTAPNLNSSNEECDPNYTPCVPVASDVDCAGKGGNGPAYVQGPVKVIGKDIYGLDRDGNGIACE